MSLVFDTHNLDEIVRATVLSALNAAGEGRVGTAAKSLGVSDCTAEELIHDHNLVQGELGVWKVAQ